MFELRHTVVKDFREYVESFLNIRDPLIAKFLQEELDRGALWPDPLLQLNPSFESGGLIDALIDQGKLDSRCGSIFRRGKSDADPTGMPLRLFKHQVQAVELAQAGRNYVLTTGTGSGKSLSYILPIVDAVLKEGSGRGIRAVIVYPMNALANSQLGELGKYVDIGPDAGSVTFDRYTGQEKAEDRDRIQESPPDILLTNYMMLELMLTRPREQAVVKAMSDLRFVVLDELHTYRGRQGADIALLMRRLRDLTGSRRIQFIGTSATMASEGSAALRRQAVADVATRIFGAPVSADEIVGETLLAYSDQADVDDPGFRLRLRASLDPPAPATVDAYKAHPLTMWLERSAGLDHDDEGRLRRALPAAISGASGISARLAAAAGVVEEEALAAIERHLLAATALPADPKSGARPFVFRLHQFLSPGLGVYSTLGDGADRFLSLDGQRTDPSNPDRLLFPLCFCRSCGQQYYLITRTTDEKGIDRIVPRRLTETPNDDDNAAGFIYLPDASQLPVDLDALTPDDWWEIHKGGKRLKSNKRKYWPTTIHLHDDGRIGGSHEAWFILTPFSLCMNCGQSYGPRESDVTKLSVLGMQGRSTATTTLAISTVEFLRAAHSANQKILSFSDNRQDASLQAGHLNDFVEVGLLRAAIHAAARAAGPEGLFHDQVTLAVEKALDLQQEEYAQQIATLPTQIKQRREALRDVLGYRIYRDLRRGWRVNAPNLEQVGLLKIEYPDLPVICEEEARWQGSHQLLMAASSAVREKICHDLLERMRRKLAIKVNYLDPEYQEGLKKRSAQLLKEPYALSEDEAFRLDGGTYAWLSTGAATDERTDLFLTPRSAYAIWLRLPSTFEVPGLKLADADVEKITQDLIRVLLDAPMISARELRPGEVGYQLNADVFAWKTTEPGEEHRRTANSFFERLYRERAVNLKGIYAREHTAQVPADERELREELFRAGRLPIMFCSPTMELGVDIADLSVVNLRNVPPTPANYAQRSGRAGRSGQPAFVFTYATGGSPHDQYYFRRPEQMVAGAVAPPRIDVANEDLVRSHIHAIWLSEASLELGSSLSEKILDVSGTEPTLVIQPEVMDRLTDATIRERARKRSRRVLVAAAQELRVPGAAWYTERWLDDIIDQIPLVFNRACDRWRNLYRSALGQAQAQDVIIRDHSASHDARTRAARLRIEAEQQMALLTDAGSGALSDFYTYRYLASEGFLPGYSFPRLPLSAYLPGRRGRSEYLSRPRFLAISEFGPGAVVYHEGSRYLADRILMPASARREGGQIETSEAKLCGNCGYLHGGASAVTADVCEHCATPLSGDNVIRSLFRLEAVNLRRRDRITCDEEERMRQGYEIRTAIRFDGRPGEEQSTRADILDAAGETIATMTFAQAATIWRINVGWNKRKKKELLGYQLDADRGRWISEEGANKLYEEEGGDEAARRVVRVVPFVEDRRNALIFAWKGDLTLDQMASLMAALKHAIQAVFQLEDSELAAEPLPDGMNPRAILLFEAAEGGAGVLRRMVDEPKALAVVAAKALELCHYDPVTLNDLGKSPRARDLCSTACYDCLMSYGNQRNHLLLDRREVKDFLVALRDATVAAASGSESRSEKLTRLLDRCDSDLERQWLHFLEERGLTLPTYAQYRIPECNTRPDFAYVHGANKVAVYIDGPLHDYPQRQQRDADQDMTLLMQGWMVHRFHHEADWTTLLETYPSVYGEKK